MLRVIHSFDVKPGVVEHSFVEWLDGRLDEITKRFGCLERKTWVFIDGLRGDYQSGRAERRPKYLNEAFWPDQDHADRFREWLLSERFPQEMVYIGRKPHRAAVRGRGRVTARDR